MRIIVGPRKLLWPIVGGLFSVVALNVRAIVSVPGAQIGWLVCDRYASPEISKACLCPSSSSIKASATHLPMATANHTWRAWQFWHASTGSGRILLSPASRQIRPDLGKFCLFAVSFVPPTRCSQR